VRKDLQNLEQRQDLRIEKVHESINERLDRVNDRIGGLEGRIKRLENDLEAMRTQATTSNRPSGYAGVGNGAAPAPPPLPPTTGTIRLRNTFPEQVSVVVNGVSYELLPNETRDLGGHPAGAFTYEVLGIQARRTVDLRPNETFTISVYPIYP